MDIDRNGDGQARVGRGYLPVRAGREYLRVSYDRSGRERSQDEQHEENQHGAAGIGVQLGEPYRDAGSSSASRYARKSRDDFARLLSDLGQGRFGAEVLVLWESSRGSRKVGEWVQLIDLCEQQGVSIYVTTHGREYHPGNGRDRRSLLEDAVDSEYESSKVSARGQRAAAASARAGKPHGRIPFGYTRRYDERTRIMIAQEPHPDEAPIVIELFARLKRGHSFRGIARDFAARGFLNDSGAPFSAAHLRSIALNPTYSGVRVHRTGGQRTARGAARPGPEVSQADATWPALVSRADYLAVQQILTDPKRRTVRPGKARHLLSMIARCDVCGGALGVTLKARPAGDYQCQAGHVGCIKAELDDYVETVMLAYLARPDVYEKITAGQDQDTGRLGEVRDELAEARAELGKLRAAVAGKKLSVDSLIAAEPGMLAAITALETTEQELTTPAVLRGLIAPGDDVEARWQEAPIATRRAIARILLTPDLLGELRVMPCPPGRKGPNRPPIHERLHWKRTEPAPPP
jgi:site-specific DNA recombinase